MGTEIATYHYEWTGPGWYAGRAVENHATYYWCGNDRSVEPNTYSMGLGTPEWLDERPEDFDPARA